MLMVLTKQTQAIRRFYASWSIIGNLQNELYNYLWGFAPHSSFRIGNIQRKMSELTDKKTKKE